MDTKEYVISKESDYDRAKMVKEFHESKAGVKGLVDSGVAKIPRIFIHTPEHMTKDSNSNGNNVKIPTVDLEGVDGERRKLIVDEIRKASETWGFFQMVNHGISDSVLDEMIKGVKQFHEQTTEEKTKIYAQDYSRQVGFYSIGDLHESQAAEWKDTLHYTFSEAQLDSEELPSICRAILVKYVRCIIKLKDTLFELLSEALDIKTNYLHRALQPKIGVLGGHYYPACPEPDITFGTVRHSDPNFLTILLQDQVGGLQIFHQNQWVDVPPMEGALIANIGDLLQIITNDKFKSVEHRVLAQPVGPRISVAILFYPEERELKLLSPVKELLSEDEPPIYKETSVNEFILIHTSKLREGKSALPYFRL